MTDSAKKKTLLLENQSLEESRAPRSSLNSMSGITNKPLKRINPLGMRVLVQLRKAEALSEGGLYLPEGAKQAMAESLLAEVIEVASAHDRHTDEEANISGVPMGALVLIPKTAGIKVPWDESLRIVDSKDILATVSEIEYV